MAEYDPVRRVDVERLCFCGESAACRWITNMADADVAGQSVHVALPKYVPDETVALSLPQPVIAPGDDACRVLATVLHHG